MNKLRLYSHSDIFCEHNKSLPFEELLHLHIYNTSVQNYIETVFAVLLRSIAASCAAISMVSSSADNGSTLP